MSCKALSLKVTSQEAFKKELHLKLTNVFAQEENLFKVLKTRCTMYKTPNPLRHALIFYYGHTATFYINKLHCSNYITERVNPNFESSFAIGVDEMSWDDLEPKNYDWPDIEEVAEYRNKVQKLLNNYIESCELEAHIKWDSKIWPVIMGIEHHRIHIETSSVLLRELDIKHVQQNLKLPICAEQQLSNTNIVKNELIDVPSGTVSFNKNQETAELYGWDNEYGDHQANLKSFKASKYLVSNSEYKEFVDAKGYDNQEYWSTEGWQWKQFKKNTMPTFWLKENESEYKLRLIDRVISMPWDWPVETNFHESEAFCRWKSNTLNMDIRLTTEDEWMHLHNISKISNISEWSKDNTPANINNAYYSSPCPVNKFKHNSLYDVVGNVWQWSSTHMFPFSGFKTHPCYDDFTVPTFDNQHALIKGGSFISQGNLANKDSRYAFRKHFMQHAGFRYVSSSNTNDELIYELDDTLAQYCDFHYGADNFNIKNFPKECIDQATQFFNLLENKNKVLDLGCAVGRASLELSKLFTEVVGLDFSAKFISQAQRILDTNTIQYNLINEGEIKTAQQITFKDLNLDNIHKNISFMQADACNLDKKYNSFDAIFAGNLIDRLYDPAVFLNNTHNLLNSKGILVLTSPYTWIEEFTKKENWLGGYYKDGKEVSSLEGLKTNLSKFNFLAAKDIPFIIRETNRKHQHTISQMTVWQLKE